MFSEDAKSPRGFSLHNWQVSTSLHYLIKCYPKPKEWASFTTNAVVNNTGALQRTGYKLSAPRLVRPEFNEAVSTSLRSQQHFHSFHTFYCHAYGDAPNRNRFRFPVLLAFNVQYRFHSIVIDRHNGVLACYKSLTFLECRARNLPLKLIVAFSARSVTPFAKYFKTVYAIKSRVLWTLPADTMSSYVTGRFFVLDSSLD